MTKSNTIGRANVSTSADSVKPTGAGTPADALGATKRMPTENPEDEESYECPTCNQSFDSKRGRNYHHTVVHNESLVRESSTCDHCGTQFEYYTKDSNGQFCSKDCLRETQTGAREASCDHCGRTFEYYPESEPGHYCSYECTAQDRTGEDGANWQGGSVKKECVICGNSFKSPTSHADRRETCSRACLADLNAERFRGEGHPRWRGGSSQQYYGRSWAHIRKRVRSDTCDFPGCEKSETDTGLNLHVHHQIPVHEFDEIEDAHFEANLITLCAEHHVGPEGLENRSRTPVRPPMEV